MPAPRLFDKLIGFAAAAVIALASSTPVAQAADAARPASSAYRVLHRFTGEEGYAPYGALVQAPDGNFYGSNFYGGGAVQGTIFRMNPKGRLSVLHSFTGPDGNSPSTGLTLGADGNLYGQTAVGGQYGGGTAFRITAKGRFTLLHSFGGPDNDGAYAYLGAMVLGPDGDFYGTTGQGDTPESKYGVAFKMTPAGQVTVLHRFAGGPGDGAFPRGQLMLATDGNFYGTTLFGGENDPGNSGAGTLYRMTPDGTVTVLKSFASSGTGPQIPQAAPTQGSDGMLYGTTSGGGKFGFGTVYRVGLDGASYTTLHSFAGGVMGVPANRDGAFPIGRLLLASDGKLYGTCNEGGPNQLPYVGYEGGAGTIFSISSAGTYASVRAFGTSETDGALPQAQLTQGADGALYGPTTGGGNLAGGDPGTLFKLALP